MLGAKNIHAGDAYTHLSASKNCRFRLLNTINYYQTIIVHLNIDKSKKDYPELNID